MSKQAIVWEDPPKVLTGRGATVWIDRLTPLLDRPGAWARVVVTSSRSGCYSSIGKLRSRRGLRIPRPEDEWEFVCRKLNDGRYGIYACYLGLSKDGESG